MSTVSVISKSPTLCRLFHRPSLPRLHHMAILKRIVFFWVGQDISIPTLLVSSVRHHFGDALEVVQLSDRKTPRVAGATHHKAMNLSPSIMVARLEAYSSLSVSQPTLYLDCDMLVTRPFDLPELEDNEIGVTTRTEKDERR